MAAATQRLLDVDLVNQPQLRRRIRDDRPPDACGQWPGVDERGGSLAFRSTPAVVLLMVSFGGADPEIVRGPGARASAPLDHGDRFKHAVQVFAIELGEQLAQRDALLLTIELGCHLEQQPLTGLADVLTSRSSWPMSIARSLVRQAAVSDAMPGAPRTW